MVDIKQLQALNEVYTRVMGQIFLNPASSEVDAEAFDELTFPQKKVLFCVEMKGPQKMSDLARQAGLTMSGATAVVDKMVRHGLVDREAEPNDRRVIRIVLTDKGREIAGQCQKLQARCFQEILEKLSSSKRDELLSSFQRIHELLAEIEGSSSEPTPARGIAKE